MKKLNLYYITLTNYDKTFQNVQVVFDENVLTETMGEILEKMENPDQNCRNRKISSRYFLLLRRKEEEFKGERRLLCPSPKDVPTYDLKPEMSAYDITNAIVPELEQGTADFVCLNFANTDMVGHTGVLKQQ